MLIAFQYLIDTSFQPNKKFDARLLEQMYKAHQQLIFELEDFGYVSGNMFIDGKKYEHPDR